MASSTAALVTFLQTELSTLSNEARKKHPAIKTAIEAALLVLRAASEVADSTSTLTGTEDNYTGNYTLVIRDSKEIMQPIILASQTNNTRLLSLAIGILLKLSTHSAIPTGRVDAALEILSRNLEEQAGETQLRVLQCIMPLLTNYPELRGDRLITAYLLCFRLQTSNTNMVRNAAMAIIRQLIIWLFTQMAEELHVPASKDQDKGHKTEDSEKLVKVGTDDGKSFMMKPLAAEAFTVLQDICLLVNDEPPLKLKITFLEKPFGLELIESVLANHSAIFRAENQKEFVVLLKEKLCTLVYRKFSEGSDFPEASRLFRLVIIIIREFHDLLPLESEMFLSLFVRSIAVSGKPWERSLLLEATKTLFSDFYLVMAMSKTTYTVDEGAERPPDFRDLLQVINQCVETAAVSAESSNLSLSEASIRVPCIEQFDKIEPPQLPKDYLLLLGFKTVQQWIDTIFTKQRPKIETTGRPGTGEAIHYKRLDERDTQALAVSELLSALWPGLLKSLTSLLVVNLDHQWRSDLLESLRQLVVITGALGLSEARDAIFECIAIASLPTHQSDPMSNPSGTAVLLITDVNISIARTLLLTAASMDELVESSWIHIVRTMHGVDQFAAYKAKRTQTLPSLPIGPKEADSRSKTLASVNTSSINLAGSAEVDGLVELIELSRMVLESSKHLSPEAFESALTAYIQASTEVMMAEVRSATAIKITVVLFPVQKVKQLALINMNRFVKPGNDAVLSEKAWTLLMDHLAFVLASEDNALRAFAGETLGSILGNFLSTISLIDLTENAELQMRVLEPLKKLGAASDHTDVHRAVLDILYKLLQTAGPSLSNGWPTVFSILQSVLNKDPVINIIRGSFSCIKLICSDYLAILSSECLCSCVDSLSSFASQTEDLNVSLTALGLLWDVADILRDPALSLKFSESHTIWIKVLQSLTERCVDLRPEVRNGAVQTIQRALLISGATLSEIEWAGVFDKVILALIENLRIAASELTVLAQEEDKATAPSEKKQVMLVVHFSRNSNEKQWDETQVLLMKGLTEILYTFIEKLLSLPELLRYWTTVLEALVHYSRTKSPELVSTAIKCLSELVSEKISEKLIEHSVLRNIWNESWQAWEQIGSSIPDSLAFSNDTLVIFVSIFKQLYQFQGTQVSATIDWLRSSFVVIDIALGHSTCVEEEKDMTKPSPLQSACINMVIDVVDFDKCPESKCLLLSQLSTWLANTKEELSEQSLVVNQSRRRPMSRTSSTISSSLITPTETIPTRSVALAALILDQLAIHLTKWATFPLIYADGTYDLVIRAIGRLAILKYRIVREFEGEPLWKLATKTFYRISDTATAIFRRLEPSIRDRCWMTTVEIVVKIMDSNRSLIPTELSHEKLEADETFDIELIDRVCEKLLPAMDQAPPASIHCLIKGLEASSRLYIEATSPVNLMRAGDGKRLAGEATPVAKERLALVSFKTLFKISSQQDHEEGEEKEKESQNRLGRSQPIRMVAQKSLPVLLDRCSRIIDQYIEAKRHLGKLPFPRVRQDEIGFVFQELADLRIAPNLMQSPQHSTEKADQTPGNIRSQLMATTRGHLFYLYPQLCACLGIDDPMLVALVRLCLVRIGEELSLLA